MGKIRVILLFLVVILGFVSCNSNAGFDPFTKNNHNLRDKVKSITETTYELKGGSRVPKRKAEIASAIYHFNALGKLDTMINRSADGTVFIQTCKYTSSGAIKSVQYGGFNAKLTFDENGNLAHIAVVDSIGEEVYYYNYTYNSNGIVSAFAESNAGSEGRSIENQYSDNGSLVGYMEYNGTSDETKYTCDSIGNIILAEIYEYDTEPLELSYKDNYEYKYDNNRNWISKIRRHKGKLVSETVRQIEYYPEEILSPNVVVSILPKSASYIDELKYKIDNISHIGGPSHTLLIIVLSLSLILTTTLLIWKRNLFLFFAGKFGSNGMKRLWMYNKEPYTKVALAILIAVCSFLAAIVVIFLFGGATWLIFWLIKILLFIIVIVGWILLVGGGLIAWAGLRGEGCGALIGGLISAGIGGSIVGATDYISNAGERLVESGFEFMQTLNLFEWGLNLFKGYWDVMIIVFVLPMLLFLAFAVGVIIISALLRGVEFIITKAYSVRRPCPVCGCTDGYHYLVEGQRHPVGLHPGVYGIFSQTSPKNGSKLPTMLINGRWKLDRECVNPNCKSKVTSQMGVAGRVGYGTDIHIGVVGHPSSGKSYLLYSGLSLLQSAYSGKFTQIDADNETRIEGKKRRIDSGDGIQTDNKSQYRAVQLMLTDKIRRIPYHLFFYDVAGEKFDASSNAHQKAMDFYRNVESIIFVVDPFMIDFTGIPTNDDLLRWIESKGQYGVKYNIGNTFSILKEILEKAGRKSKKIDFSFVCVKKDLGYLEVMGYSGDKHTNKDIEKFVCSDMGLNNVVNSARAEFKEVKFFAVSAISKNTDSLKTLFVETLKQRGVKL